MTTKLYSDSDAWQVEYSADVSNTEIARQNGINGRFRLITWCGDMKQYRVDKTGYTFSVRTVDA